MKTAHLSDKHILINWFYKSLLEMKLM